MKIREYGNNYPIPTPVEVENETSLALIAETKVQAPAYGLHPTVNDVDCVLGEAARTLRNEVEAIASLADRDGAASRILENDYPVLPCRDEPLDAEIALLISGIEEELAVMAVLAETLAARLRGIAGQEQSNVGKMQASRGRHGMTPEVS